MSIYSLANLTTNVTNGSAAQEILSSANVGYRLLELGITLSGATASTYGFGRPSAAATTPTSPVTVLAEDAGNTTAGNTTTALAWAVGPAAPTAYNRRVSFSNTLGSGIMWTFPRGFSCNKGGSGQLSSCGLWNLAANGVLSTWIVVDE
jgi:hypothetical protein